MMRDPSFTRLRRRILETVNEQPALGQLDTIVAVTSAMPQRRPLAVRLKWLLEPVWPFGPLASTRLRVGVVLVALLLIATLAAVVGGGSQPRPTTPFEGTWTSTDTADGSTQTLVVEAGAAPAVHFEDRFSINCKNRGETSTLYLANGQGEIAEGRLTVQFPEGGCTVKVPAAEWWYEYQSSLDSLVDYQGITWSRAP